MCLHSSCTQVLKPHPLCEELGESGMCLQSSSTQAGMLT